MFGLILLRNDLNPFQIKSNLVVWIALLWLIVVVVVVVVVVLAKCKNHSTAQISRAEVNWLSKVLS